MKKLVSLLVILCLICSMVPFILASADLNGTMGSWDFSASAEFITIEKYNGSEISVNVPERINGNEVVAIASNAFAENKTIKSVKIPDTVSYIYDNAFYGCENLATIDAHNYMYVGKQAFEGTAFYNDESNWQNGVLYLYDLVLKAKPDIKTVSIFENTHAICVEAFKNCAYLTSVTIPVTVSSIDENAFDGCSKLNEVIFEKNSAETDFQIVISDYAFLNCSSLKSVKLPENVVNIATYAFGFKLEGTEYVKNNDFIIYGAKGTLAQDYAELNSYKFVEYDFAKDSVVNQEPEECSHTTVLKNKKQATYFKVGYSGDSVCSKCNVVVKKGKSIAKLTLKIPTFKTVNGKKQFKVKYTKVKNATGFQVRYKLKGKWKIKNFDTKRSVTKLVKGLKKGNYQVQIRAFVKQGSKKAYSDWAKARKVKVK